MWILLFTISLTEIFAAPLCVYLTLEENPSTSISIRWITDKEIESNFVEYRQGGYPNWQEKEGNCCPMPDKHPYLIHHITLKELKPDSDYFFRFKEGGEVYKFRTLPQKLHTPLRFVVGGDMLHDDWHCCVETNIAAAATDPAFAILGGDIAYSAPKNSFFKEEIKHWIKWLTTWSQTMVTSDGRLIPFLITIGNHETIGRYEQKPEQAKFFYALFKWPNMEGFSFLDFDDYMTVWLLDSGHTHPIDGEQKKWLEKTLESHQETPHKFAIYHVPAYPSVRKFTNKRSTPIRAHWCPLFEKYRISAAFEHHDHAYKRSHLIADGEVNNEKGILYLGDGAWGVKKPRKPKSSKQRWYLAKTAPKQHFILVTLYGKSSHFMAIDNKGEPFDHFSLPYNR